MEYNQDTGLASVSRAAVTMALPHVSIRWRYEGGGPRGLRSRKGEWCPCVFVDCYLRAI